MYVAGSARPWASHLSYVSSARTFHVTMGLRTAAAVTFGCRFVRTNIKLQKSPFHFTVYFIYECYVVSGKFYATNGSFP